MEEKDKYKVIRVRNIPADIHEAFKIAAIRANMSMEALLLKLITEYVAKNDKGGK